MGFQCSNMLTALPSAFLDRLLSAALMEDAEIRLFVLEILISFIDRHGNRQKFSTIRYVLGAPQQGWDPAEPGLGGRSAGLGALAGLLINQYQFWGGLMLQSGGLLRARWVGVSLRDRAQRDGSSVIL